jgi:hypothetical protein
VRDDNANDERSFKMKVYIQGSGMEVCLTKLSEEDVKKFKDNEDDIDISKIMGKEWPELHDV